MRETGGYSGADLSSLVRNAALTALQEREDERQGLCVVDGGVGPGETLQSGPWRPGLLARRHFEAALESTKPSSGPGVIAKHEAWARQWRVL